MTPTRARVLFEWIAVHPRAVLAATLLPTLAAASFVPTLVKDTRNEAFMPATHPAVVYREYVKDVFGLTDPVVIAVVNDSSNGGIFNPATLRLVAWLTDRMRETAGIDPERVTSLATEKSIRGTQTEMLVEPFLDEPPITVAAAERVRRDVMRMELYRGSLVSEDGTATAITGELIDSHRDAESVYAAISELIQRASTNGERLYVAGEGAASAYLGRYIDRDAQRLNPLAALVIVSVLWIAHRTVRGVLLPLVVVAGALAVSLGTMAGAGIPFFVVTSALPVILIGIAICDSIHILGRYYEILAEAPDKSHQEVVVETMCEMWRPVLITSLTSIGGFLALSVASFSPPMRAFGIFASIGVLAALLLSLLAVPAGLVLRRAKESPAFRHRGVGASPDTFGAFVLRLGAVVRGHPGAVLVAAGAVASVAGLYATAVTLDDERIRYFQPGEPIREAIIEIDRRLAGTSYLDIVVEADRVDGLLDPENLRRVQELQTFVAGLPHVKTTTSIVDYLEEMSRAMNEDRADAKQLPRSEELIAQYLLLHSASADPADLEEVIDYDYRLANLRVTLERGRWSDFNRVVRATEPYIAQAFPDDSLQVHLAGPANVSHHRAMELARSHPLGVGLAFAAVAGITAILFHSLSAGLLALVPVCLAVLMVYGLMGGLDIWLGSGTSMTSAIAVGLSIDFSVHVLNRLQAIRRGPALDAARGMDELFLSTGRALLFNLAAILLGFGVLALSSVPSLRDFGLLVVVCVGASFLASLTVVPALILMARPSWIGFRARAETSS